MIEISLQNLQNNFVLRVTKSFEPNSFILVWAVFLEDTELLGFLEFIRKNIKLFYKMKIWL